MSEYSEYNTPNAQRPTPNVCPKSDDTIHVVLAVYDPKGTYSQHAGVVMTSIFENTKSKVTVHILHDNTLTEDNRQKFIRTAEKYSQGIELHDVTEYFTQFSFPTYHLTIGAVYRLVAPRILKFEKVIYLDADIVVNLDIKELWDIDIGRNCIAGFHGAGFETFSNYILDKLNGGDCHDSINSGVMIMNLDAIRAKGDLFDDAMEWFSRRYHLAFTADQSFINAYFTGSTNLIEKRFNFCNPSANQDIKNCIIHTPGSFKVWGMSGLPFQRLYWKYYLKSAWGENITPSELADKLCSVAETTLSFFHMTPYPCLKRTLIKVPQKIFWTNQLMFSLRIIVKDIYYRLKHRLTHR
ncbi:MAG: glycosyltransferase family 8 protein [Synergistaceae bacterium]|nr:glycosyltransferase family 8 protein [Synergistaceae bacterium]